jgi:hypothetical protein
MADVARKAPAASPRCPRRRIDPHPLRHGEVDRQALVPGGRPDPFCDCPAAHRSVTEALVGQSLRVYRVAALAKMAEST